MTLPDLKIGSRPIMTNQPTHIEIEERGLRKITRLADGTYVGSNRDGGRIVKVTWGADVAADGAYDELLADLAAENSVFTLTFEDPNANAVSIPVIAEPIGRKFGPAPLYGQFTVTFFETT